MSINRQILRMDHSKVTLPNLMVIDIAHATSMEGDTAWKKPAFFAAEDCDRQLLLGSKTDKDLVPHNIRDRAKHQKLSKPVKDATVIEYGGDAYKHVLRAATGMLDKQLGEKKPLMKCARIGAKLLSNMRMQRAIKRVLIV